MKVTEFCAVKRHHVPEKLKAYCLSQNADTGCTKSNLKLLWVQGFKEEACLPFFQQRKRSRPRQQKKEQGTALC